MPYLTFFPSQFIMKVFGCDKEEYILFNSVTSASALSTLLGKTFFAWRFILNKTILF